MRMACAVARGNRERALRDVPGGHSRRLRRAWWKLGTLALLWAIPRAHRRLRRSHTIEPERQAFYALERAYSKQGFMLKLSSSLSVL